MRHRSTAVLAAAALALLLGVGACNEDPAPMPVGAPKSLADLPTRWYAPQGPDADLLVLLLTGDGNMAHEDRVIVDSLTARGVPVVALLSRTYLRSDSITARRAADDTGRILTAALARWPRRRWALVGYSRGAVMAPFIVNRLPHALTDGLAHLVLLGTDRWASFHFHWIDLLTKVHRPDEDVPVQPELEKLRGLPILCVYGTEDSNVLCPLLPPGLATVVSRPGGHHIEHPAIVIPDILKALGLTGDVTAAGAAAPPG